MKIFVCESFSGHNPVGACAVITAENDIEAAKVLEAELSECGLDQKVEPYQMDEIDINIKRARIIVDGDY